jgi:hypothetical protein
MLMALVDDIQVLRGRLGLGCQGITVTPEASEFPGIIVDPGLGVSAWFLL